MRFILLTAMFLTLGNAVQSQTETYFSVPVVDAPEFAARGAYSVGVRTIELKNPNQVDILNFDKNTGKAPTYERPLKIEVWYPATIPAGVQERTVYEMGFPRGGKGFEGVPKEVAVLGKALRDAEPVKGLQFRWLSCRTDIPVRVTFLSYLSENPRFEGLRGCSDRPHGFGIRGREGLSKHSTQSCERSVVYHWRA